MSLFKPKKTRSDIPSRRRAAHLDTERSEAVSRQIFRRNRTLTGSRSGLFGSATENQADLVSPRATAHELAAKRRRITKLFLGVSAGAVVLAGLLWQLIATVEVYAGSGVALKGSEQYRQTINDYLLRQPLQRFRISLDESALTAYISASHPEVKAAELRQPSGLASSRIELTMRKPVASWSVNGQNQYVDDDGTAFTVNYFASPDIQIVDNSGIDPASGAAVASTRFLGFVGHVVRLSDTLGYEPASVTIPPATTRQIDVSYKNINYPIKYTIDRSAGEQVEDMSRAVKHLESRRISPKYLDVRVSGRAYYR